ncbi:MAG: hypothetical protein QGG64_05760 [Candidatus Latescibacteria bacterium]|nr:hypothetical protein [Candidatus Latescibacterota bacterium]
MKRLTVVFASLFALISCGQDALLTPAELDQSLTVENVAFEPRNIIASINGTVDLNLIVGKPTLGKVLVRNAGTDFSSDLGVKMTIIVYDAEGRPLDSGSDTKYGILGNGRSTLFELSLEPPHNTIHSYEVTFEMERK